MTAEHLNADIVADHLEGLLDPADSDAARAHLHDCAACARLRDDLVHVRHLLAAPEAREHPMPEAVAHRVGDAIDRESAARTRSTGVSSLTAAHRRNRRWQPRLGRVVAAAAGLVVLAGAGAVAVQQLSGPASSPTAKSAGGSGAQRSTTDQPSTGQPSSGSPDLTAAGFAAAVRSAVAEQAGPSPSDSPSVKSVPGSHALAGGDPTEQCVTRTITAAAGAGQHLLTANPARWHGTTVQLAVTGEDGTGRRTVEAYAIAGCPDSGRIVHREQVQLPAQR